jgi:hypothetical protein
MGKKQWGHGFYSGLEKDGGPFEAIRAGAGDAIWRAMNNITMMPGTDTFDEMTKGFEEGIENFLVEHEDKIIEAIANKATSIHVYGLTSLKQLFAAQNGNDEKEE